MQLWTFNLTAGLSLQAVFVGKCVSSTHLAKYHSINPTLWSGSSSLRTWTIFGMSVFQWQRFQMIDWQSYDSLAARIFFNSGNTFLVPFLSLWCSSMSAVFRYFSWEHSEKYNKRFSNLSDGKSSRWICLKLPPCPWTVTVIQQRFQTFSNWWIFFVQNLDILFHAWMQSPDLKISWNRLSAVGIHLSPFYIYIRSISDSEYFYP